MISPETFSATTSMDSNTSDHRLPKSTTATLSPNETNSSDGAGAGGDPKVWAAFTDNFRQVQTVLDRNRVLIQQVNENHQSKVHDNMVKNVALIQEINGNISKVASLYSDLSTNFSSAFRQRSGVEDDEGKRNEDEEK